MQAAIPDFHFRGEDLSILEAKVLEFAMKWAINNEVKYIRFELDAQRVVQAIKNYKTNNSEF